MKVLILAMTMLVAASCGKDGEAGLSNANQLVQSTDRSADSNAVTNEFGKLYVQEGSFTYEADAKPWSSWWFPSLDRFMFERDDTDAPLVKYDEYVSRKYSVKSTAAEFEEVELYNPGEAPWAGLCHAWAVASVLHPEPSRAFVKNNVLFGVADQKALLLKSYESVSNLKIYGKRYDGNYGDDFRDVYPDQFHRFAQIYLSEQKKPFLMDYDPSYPVWTVPVYKAKFDITRETSNSVLVRAWATYASPHVAPEFVGTREIVKSYSYRMYGQWEGANFLAIDSEWIDESVYDHPDYMISFPSDVKKGSYNNELKIEYVEELLKN